MRPFQRDPPFTLNRALLPPRYAVFRTIGITPYETTDTTRARALKRTHIACTFVFFIPPFTYAIFSSLFCLCLSPE